MSLNEKSVCMQVRERDSFHLVFFTAPPVHINCDIIYTCVPPQHPKEELYHFATPSTMKPTQIASAPGTVNQLPSWTEIMGDIRLTPFYDIDQCVEKMTSVVKELNNSKSMLASYTNLIMWLYIKLLSEQCVEQWTCIRWVVVGGVQKGTLFSSIVSLCPQKWERNSRIFIIILLYYYFRDRRYEGYVTLTPQKKLVATVLLHTPCKYTLFHMMGNFCEVQNFMVAELASTITMILPTNINVSGATSAQLPCMYRLRRLSSVQANTVWLPVEPL